MTVQAILVEFPLRQPQAVLAAVTEQDPRAALWDELGRQVHTQLQPWFDMGWELVPGTLGPHSLRLGPASQGRGLLARVAILLRFGRGRPPAAGPEVCARSAACLLIRRL